MVLPPAPPRPPSVTIAPMTDLAQQMCAIGRRAYARQLIDGSGGNFSCRLDRGRILCTPTGLCKGLLEPADLCIVSDAGTPIAGARRPSTELGLHLAIYAADERIGAIIHAHPPFATTLSVLGEGLAPGLLPEGEVFLGPVPLIPYQTPGTPALGAAVQPYVRDRVAAILQNHGTVTWGPDLESAYLLTETLEAVSRVECQARMLGGIQPIPPEERAKLAALRARLREWAG